MSTHHVYENLSLPASTSDHAPLVPLLPSEEAVHEDSPFPAWQYLSSLRKHALAIALFCAACLLITYVVSKRIVPVFESTLSLEINRDNPSGVVGQDSMRSAWNDSDQYIATQMKVIQEDSVLRPVAERFGLLAQQDQETSLPSGGNALRMKQLRVVRPPNTYLIQVSYRSTNRILAAAVANAVAESYFQHVFRERLEDTKSETTFMERQLDELRASIERSSATVSEYERRLGIVDPQDKTNILSARLLQLNTEYTTAQSDRIRKEAEYLGLKSGAMPAAQQSEQGEALKQLQQQLDEANQKFAELQSHYGPKHPEYLRQAALVSELQEQIDSTRRSVVQRASVAYQDAVSREALLKRELTEAKTAFDDLNTKSSQYQTLKGEVDGNRKLYDDLEQKIKEAGINANFRNSTMHVTDPARPAPDPLYPNLPLNLSLAGAFSLLMGFGAAVIYDLADDSLKSVGEIQSAFNTEVLAAIPVTREKIRALPARSSRRNLLSIAPEAEEIEMIPAAAENRQSGDQFDRFEESVRMLWSSFQLANVDHKCRSLLITSAVPGEGKTTISLQLALANAKHGRKTLLVDGDLRRPSAHRHAGLSVSPGIVDAMERGAKWKDFIRKHSESESLHILTAGLAQRKAFDQVVYYLPELLSQAQNEYDLVIIDSPPLLAFAEPLHMARAADGVILVVCADKTSRRAVASVLRTLRRLRADVLGVVLNRVGRSGDSNAYYAYSSYHFKSLDVSA